MLTLSLQLYQGVKNIFEYSNILVTNIYSELLNCTHRVLLAKVCKITIIHIQTRPTTLYVHTIRTQIQSVYCTENTEHEIRHKWNLEMELQSRLLLLIVLVATSPPSVGGVRSCCSSQQGTWGRPPPQTWAGTPRLTGP